MNPSEALKSKATDSGLGMRETYVNLPNAITLLRILLIPVFVWLFSESNPDRALAAALA